MKAALADRHVDSRSPVSDASLLRGYQAGDDGAATELYQRYGRRVWGLARSTCQGRLVARLDPDDIVQAVFVRFFRAVRRRLYALPEEGSAWQILLVITLNRVRKEASYHQAARRDVRQTQRGGAFLHQTRRLHDQNARQSQATCIVREVLESMPLDLREIVSRRLEGYTVVEIAHMLGISRRKTERRLHAARWWLTGALGLPLAAAKKRTSA